MTITKSNDRLRIATYNVEWFASLFDDQNQLIFGNSWSGRHDVTKAMQTNALALVFKAMDADAIMVIEAPNTGRVQDSVSALEHFADTFKLRQSKAVSGFANDTQQEITLLYDPDKFEAFHDPQGRPSGPKGSRVAPRFDTAFRLDVNVDDQPDHIEFSKPPLELELRPNTGIAMRMIGVHAKSKAPHGARNKTQEVRIAIDNRRKQLAQCIWLRQRIEDHLNAGDPLIVLGDFNDGPGLDEYEKLFGHSGVEIALGSSKEDALRMREPHAEHTLSPRRGTMPTTARFYNHRTKRYLNALLDYIMVSPDIFEHTAPEWKIWHPFDDPDCFADPELRDALLTGSDHFPVTVDLNWAAMTRNSTP